MNYKHFITLTILMSMMFPKVMAEKYLPYIQGKRIIDNGGYVYFFDGDTLVNNVVYKKVYGLDYRRLFPEIKFPNSHQRLNEKNASEFLFKKDSLMKCCKNNLNYYLALREDTISRMVYSIDIKSSSYNEWVYIDFSFGAVSTWLPRLSDVHNLVVGKVTIDGETRPAWSGKWCNIPVGCIMGIGNMSDPVCWTTYNLSSFGIGILYDDNRFRFYDFALLKPLAIDKTGSDEALAKIVFQTTNSQLVFTLQCNLKPNNQVQYVLIGANGSVVSRGRFTSASQSIPLTPLSPGLYLAVVTTSAGEVLGRHKFVVK